MKLTPQDIHHKEFKRGIRGYSEEEVDLFLDQVADQYEQLYKRNHSLEEETQQLKEKLKTYQNMELTLQNTLLTAQKSAEEVQMNAKKEADVVVNNAKAEVKRTLSKASKQKQTLSETLAKLRNLEDTLKNKIKSDLDSLMQRLDKIGVEEQQVFQEIEQEFANIPQIDIPKVEQVSVEVEASIDKEVEEAKEKPQSIETAVNENQPQVKADASKSDIASEAEIDKFLQQEPEDYTPIEEATEGEKKSILGRIFGRKEAVPEDGEPEEKIEEAVPEVKVEKKKEKKPKAKKSKQKNTQEIKA